MCDGFLLLCSHFTDVTNKLLHKDGCENIKMPNNFMMTASLLFRNVIIIYFRFALVSFTATVWVTLHFYLFSDVLKIKLPVI